MTNIESAQAGNANQIEYWNASAGNTWATHSDRFDRMIGPLGQVAMEALAPTESEKILDIGCGCGQTTIEIGRRVGKGGAVTGVDISAPMLEVARARANLTGAPQVRFLQADAQVHPFEAAEVDAAFSRFGVMFFSDPVPAFLNINRALAPNGRLAFVCWRAIGENPMMSLPMSAALPLLPEPPPPPDPHAPGPFAFADRDRLAGILTAAGFHKIEISPHNQAITNGNLDQTVEMSLKVGPLGVIMRERPDLAERIVDVISEALIPYQTDGGVFMPSATWIVKARKDKSP